MQLQNFKDSPQDLLSDEIYYERASAGKRLANYIIDVIVYYLLAFAIVFAISAVSPGAFDTATSDDSGLDIMDRIISLLFYALYMSIMEAIFKGKSVGKFITQTRAVYYDGSPIAANSAFSRGFSRAVPFCVFSALGDPCNPWQDRWTNTLVINDTKRF